MKWRNELLALACLVIFAGLGVVYFRQWVVQKPFGIILFVGEGLTPARITAARQYSGGADARTAFDRLSQVALVRNASADFAVPDAAAAATAIATGVKTSNGSIGTNEAGARIATLLELAHEAGRATGLVTDGELTNSTAAAFYAHRREDEGMAAIAEDLIGSNAIDVAFGGGADVLLPQHEGGTRTDSRNLLAVAQQRNRDVVRTRADLFALPAWRRPNVIGAFAKAALADSDDIDARANQPSLADMVERAIQLLQYNTGGYLLVVNAHLMGAAAGENDAERTLRETIELSRAIDSARTFAGSKALFLVTGDAGIGGMTLSEGAFRNDSGIALLGVNARGEPTITWATGPNGARGRTDSRPEDAASEEGEPAALYQQRALKTTEDVVLLGTGVGANAVSGVIDQSEIFRIVRSNL